MDGPSRLASRGSSTGKPDDEVAVARAVREMFRQVVPHYDFLNHFLSFGRDVAWRKFTAKALRQPLARPGSVAVDVCCGTGDMALALARLSAGKIVGTDFCRPMLARAQEKAKQARSAALFLEADTLALPFADGTFDVVSVAFGFRNLANYAAGLAEMNRILKAGGHAAILEFSRVRWPVFGPIFRFYFHQILPRLGTWISGVSGPYQYLPESVARFPDQEELTAALRGAGFREVRCRNFAGGVAALHLGRKAS